MTILAVGTVAHSALWTISRTSQTCSVPATASTPRLLGLSGGPWQPAYNHWAFNLPRGPALAEKWALIPPGLDVLITHGPPLGLGPVDVSE